MPGYQFLVFGGISTHSEKKKMIEHIQAAWQPVGKCWVLAVWPFDKHLAGEKLGHSKSRANLIHGKCQKICPSMIFHFQFLRENV